jgi:hypothetical protein
MTASDGQLRAKGAEMMLKYPAAFANLEDDDADDALPEGVFVVYPSLLVED